MRLPADRLSPSNLAEVRGALWLLVVALIIGLSMPLLRSPPQLSVDYSLYLSEAVNIASGDGYTFAWGGDVVYRPPGLPAMFAAAFLVLGHSVDSANHLTSLIAVLNSLLVLWLGYRSFGPVAGVVAGALAASSTFINAEATRQFIDGAGAFFLLLSLSTYLEAMRSERKAWFAISGVTMACAFLVKESFVVWAALPAFVWLLMAERRTVATTVGTVIYACGWLAAAAWWWVWVYAASGEIYQASFMPPELVVALLGALLVAASAGEYIRRRRGTTWDEILTSVSSGTFGRLSLGSYYAAAGVALLAAWMAVALIVMQGSTTEGRGDLLASAKLYLVDVAAPAIAPNLQIFYAMLGLLLASWVVAGVVGFRQRRVPAIVLFLGAALFLPQFLFVADRALQPRNMIPLLYLGFVLFGGALALTVRSPGVGARPLKLGLAAFGMVVIAASVAFVVREEHTYATRYSLSREFGWENRLVRDAAAWAADNVEPGTPTMSSWLFYSQLYVESDGAFPIRQVPMVHARLEDSDEVLLETVRRGPRFENYLDGPATDREPWLYVRWNPRSAVYYALSEQTLVDKINMHDIEYLFLTGDDPQSPLRFADYFQQSPGLTSVYRDKQGGWSLEVFEVDPAHVRYRAWPLTVDPRTLLQLVRDMRAEGLYKSDAERIQALAPNGLRICPPNQPLTDLLHEFEQELGETLLRGTCPSTSRQLSAS